MAIQHVKGDFFDGEHSARHRDFGFRDSAPMGRHDRAPDRPTEDNQITDHYARGGESHPHGHSIVHVERRPDGRMIEHHAHGGHTVHHPHGMVSHHYHDGSPVHAAHGGFAHDEEAEYVHRPENEHLIHRASGGSITYGEKQDKANEGLRSTRDRKGRLDALQKPNDLDMQEVQDQRDSKWRTDYLQKLNDSGMQEVQDQRDANGYKKGGPAGDEAEDKRMIKKAFSEHDRELHHGEHTDLHLARGGFAGRRVRLPRDMSPAGERPHSPINTPPRNPNVTSSPANDMAGGQMPYGMQPSSEPSGGDMAQMHRGGRTRK